MSRNTVTIDGQTPQRSVSSIVCLALILLLAISFWVGAFWVGSLVLKLILN